MDGKSITFVNWSGVEPGLLDLIYYRVLQEHHLVRLHQFQLVMYNIQMR